RVSMWKGRTREQKEELAKAITKALVEIAGTEPEHVHIIFEDVEKSDWAIAGRLCDRS
ncbi:MAG: 4-oxalocrotonate tautomerase, partial [Euryarchaeota archaeon]|nr:4-oxalocrotonate tautomerase [Euryarchaeota archaeon]